MIDTTKESPLTLSHAAKSLREWSRNGRQPHVAQVYRWASRGLRGIILETVQIGGSKCTTREAAQRFIGAMSNPGRPAAPRTPAKRQKQAEAASGELAKAGW